MINETEREVNRDLLMIILISAILAALTFMAGSATSDAFICELSDIYEFLECKG